MSTPRLGRGFGLAALHAQRPHEDRQPSRRPRPADVGFSGRPATTRLLEAPAIAPLPPSPPRPAWEAVQTHAAQLAALLEPLPGALGEIATRISRHCAVAGRDADLSATVDAVRARTWQLSLAVHRLAEAAGKRGA